MRVGSIEAMRLEYQPGEDESNSIPTLQFDAAWRAACRVEVCERADIDPFIKAHYIGKWPGVCVLVLGMMKRTVMGYGVRRQADGNYARMCGGVVFALPPRETAKRYGGITWELARLWIQDEVPSNAETWLIAQAVRHIRKHRPEVQTLVSYADPSVGHKGTIYKAANWKPDGRTDDERKTPRFDYADASTGKKYSRRGHVPEGVTIKRVPRVSKHRFIFHCSTPSGGDKP
jgi:hypothetical protein